MQANCAVNILKGVPAGCKIRSYLNFCLTCNEPKPALMKRISYWAKLHPWSARGLIVLLYCVLNLSGFLLGRLLLDTGFQFHSNLGWIAAGIILAVFVFYPSGRFATRRPTRYLERKLADAILLAATFLVIVSSANRFHDAPFCVGFVRAALVEPVSKDTTGKIGASLKSFSGSMYNSSGKPVSLKTRVHLLQKQVKKVKASNDLSSGERTVLITLSILVAIFAVFGLAALACNLSCSGAEGLAWLVGLGGTALIIFLFLIVIKAINRKTKRKTTL